MNPSIPTIGQLGPVNSQGQEVPAFPDNGDFVTSNPAAFFAGPVTLYASSASEITVIPEGKRTEVGVLIDAYKIANGGTAPESVSALSGIGALTRVVNLPEGVCLPFRVCMVTEVTGSVLAVY